MGSTRNAKDVDVYVIPNKESEDGRKMKRQSSLHINTELLRFKLHYFLYIGGLAASMPYIVVFGTDRIGITASSLGVLLIAQMFLFIFTKPLMGYIADYFNRLKLIISLLVILSTVCFFILLAIPKIRTCENVLIPDRVEDFVGATETSAQCHTHDAFLRLVAAAQESISATESGNETGVDFNICALCIVDGNYTGDCVEICAKSLLERSCHFNESMIHDQMPLENSQHDVYIREKLIIFIERQNSSINICICNKEAHCQYRQAELADDKMCLPGDYASTNLKILCISSSQQLLQSIDSCESRDEFIGKPTRDFETYQFWIFAIFMTIANICFNAIFALSDTACNETVLKTGASFGKQRLYGGVGWGIVAPLAGLANDYTEDYLAAWTIMAVMYLLFLWNISKLDLVKPNFSQNILGDFSTVVSSREFQIFEVVILMNGIGAGMIWFYLTPFLVSIGASKMLCGLSLTIQSFLGVIPFMFFSEWIIRRIGHFKVLLLALLFNAVRFAWYSQLYNPWWVLPMEFTHGITYGLYYTALAEYGKISSKPGTEATTQAVIFSTHDGLGCGLGCVIAGVGFDSVGGHRTFLYSSLFAGCGLVLSLLLSLFLKKQKPGIETTTSMSSVISAEQRI